jgi:hypothetical protein
MAQSSQEAAQLNLKYLLPYYQIVYAFINTTSTTPFAQWLLKRTSLYLSTVLEGSEGTPHVEISV